MLTAPGAAAELEGLKAEVDAFSRLMGAFATISAPDTRRPAMDADPLGPAVVLTVVGQYPLRIPARASAVDADRA
jgi:hypothetical protein